MRKTQFWLMTLATAALMLAGCDGGKKPSTALQPPIEIVPIDSIPGIFEAHGTIGEGTSMNVMEFINDDGDTLYVNINSQAVMGGVNVGDEVEVIYNVSRDEIYSSVAVNLTALQHLWTQRGEDGHEQSLELDQGGRATTYDMTIDYDSWEVNAGMLLLRAPKKIADESPAVVDSFEIMQLTPDSLVLMHGSMVTEFARYN